MYVLLFLFVVGLIYLAVHWRLMVSSVRTQVAMYEAQFGDGDHWRKKVWGDDDNADD